MRWNRKSLTLLGSNIDRAAQRVQKLNEGDLQTAMHNTLSSVARDVRNRDFESAEEYSEVLVIIIREMKSRG